MRKFTYEMHGLAAVAVVCILVWQSAAGVKPFKTLNAKAYRLQNGDLLEPGKPVERELAKNEAHSYRINLEAGQCLKAEVGQKSQDVHLIVHGPDSGKILELDSPNGTQGIESVLLAAETTGVYRLTVSSAEESSPAGRYSVLIEEARTLTEQDRTALAAQTAFSEAGELKAAGTKVSLRQSISKYEESLHLYQIADNRVRQADALHYIGRSYHLLGEPRQEFLFNTRALELAQSARDRSREGFILDAIGSAYSGLGDNRKALQFFIKALAARQDAGDQVWEAISLKHIALISVDLGEYQKSLDYLNKALALNRRIGNQRGEASSLRSIGLIYSRLGETQAALESCNQALLLNRVAGDQKIEATLASVIGRLYSDLGEYQKAFEFSDRALLASRAGRNRRVEAGVLNSRSQTYLKAGRSQKAIRLLGRELALRRLLGDRQGEVGACREIGKTYLGLGEWRKSLRLFNRALVLSQAQGDIGRVAEFLNYAGEVYYHLGETQKAQEHFDEALPSARDSATRPIEAAVLYNLARLECERGNLNAARTHIEAALEIITDTRAAFYSPDLRAAYFASVQDYYRFYIDLLMQMRPQQDERGLEALALEASEKARARSLLDLLAESHADIRRGVEPELLSRERELRLLLNGKIELQLRLLGAKPTEEQKSETEGEIAKAAAEYQSMLTEIRLQSPRYGELTQVRPVSLEEIQRTLDADTLLLEYSLGEARSYLWLVSQDSIEGFELGPRAKIETAARSFYELLTARSPRAGETRAHLRTRTARADARFPSEAMRLSRMLLGPASVHLGSKRLLIVADGVLQYVPFAALPDPAATSGEQNTRQPLIVDHEITSLPSASVLVSLRKGTTGRIDASKSVAVIADPVFDSNDPRVKQSSKPAAPESERSFGPSSTASRVALRAMTQQTPLARLPFTRYEAESIVASAPSGSSTETLDFASNRVAATRDTLGQHRFVHFATHGWLDAEHPELSGIVLSLVDENGHHQEGFLGLGDIYNMRLPVEMVVLSACQTGLGKQIRGEGLVGLTRGFMYAGSRRVVASLWRVEDFATAQLMKRFYNRILKSGQSPAAALRGAQQEMWEKRQWRSAYYWAAFVLQGEWK